MPVREVLDAQEHVHHEVAEDPDHDERAPEPTRQRHLVGGIGLLGGPAIRREARCDAGRRTPGGGVDRRTSPTKSIESVAGCREITLTSSQPAPGLRLRPRTGPMKSPRVSIALPCLNSTRSV